MQDQSGRVITRLCLTYLCRFEVEENQLEGEEMERLRLSRYAPIIYCYELQLHPSVHRKGLGKRLMQMLELVVSRSPDPAGCSHTNATVLVHESTAGVVHHNLRVYLRLHFGHRSLGLAMVGSRSNWLDALEQACVHHPPPVHPKATGCAQPHSVCFCTILPPFALQALKYSMHMVLLTVQKSNEAAGSFYTALGYKQHPSCPERNGFADFDDIDPGHRIMFKDLRRN